MGKYGLFLRIMLIIAGAEFLAMEILSFAGIPEGMLNTVLDTLFLTVFTAPFLYLYVVKSMVKQLSEQEALARTVSEQRAALDAVSEKLELKESAGKQYRIQLRRLEVLNRIGTSMLRESGTETMLSEATNEICRSLNYPRCAIRIFGDPDKVFEHHAADLPAEVPITPCSQRFPGSRATFEAGGSVVVNDMGQLVDPCLKSEMERVRLKAYLGTPLYYREELLGVLCFSYSDPHEWQEDEITAAAAIANQIAMAIRHDRMLEERERNRKELSLLATAVEQLGEAVCITDTGGVIQYANPAFERITGYSFEEAVGKDPRILCSGKQDESFYREMWGTLVRGEIWKGHFINRRKDGSLYEEDATISPVHNLSGEIVNYVAVKRDVTKLVSLEKQVKMAQKMESVGTLAGGIAHDFNNVLTVVIGYGEMLKLRIANDPKAISDLDEILHSAERASVLTRQLLTFARRQVFDLANLDLNEVVTGLVKLLRKVTREDIEIKTFLAEGVPTIRADRGQVEQVLMNLSLNARDAMPGGGQLVVETQDAWLDEEYVKQYPYMKAGRYAVLSVSDTGIGMDEETRERIFEPFFTTKGPDKGTGLGLSMVYGIVKQHNGFIHVYSEPGKGTTFRICFPAVDAPSDAKVVAARGIIRGGSETILLAEDNESVRHLAEQTLITYGYRVLIACDGEEAVDVFRRHGKEIAMVVLDVVMPKKGGKEAYDEMIKTIPGLKVLFLSGYSSDAIHDTFVLHPGIPFLQKPFGPGALARKVREVLGA